MWYESIQWQHFFFFLGLFVAARLLYVKARSYVLRNIRAYRRTKKNNEEIWFGIKRSELCTHTLQPAYLRSLRSSVEWIECQAVLLVPSQYIDEDTGYGQWWVYLCSKLPSTPASIGDFNSAVDIIGYYECADVFDIEIFDADSRIKTYMHPDSHALRIYEHSKGDRPRRSLYVQVGRTTKIRDMPEEAIEAMEKARQVERGWKKLMEDEEWGG
jgi:hypothetical protein